MAERSPVHEQQCGDRRKDIYKLVANNKEATDTRLNAIDKEYSEMKGGIKLAAWSTPILVTVIVLALGVFVKLQVDSIKHEVRSRDVFSGSANAVDVKWSNEEDKFIPIGSGTVNMESVICPTSSE